MCSIEGQVVSDDDVGNEDLSLEIVHKAMERASQSSTAGVDAGATNLSVAEDVAAGEPVTNGVVKKKIVKVKKKRAKKISAVIATGSATMMKEEEAASMTKEAEGANISGTKDVDNNSDNVILRKLLRGPRYFDPPNKSWGACYNCGEEGHSTANCTSARRKKPCFICGSLEHEAKQCQKDCFICKGGHRAKDCPKKFKGGSPGSELCLKCGASAHAMSSCNNDYPTDNLKEIQCYVCKRFGHLCCADYSNALPSEVSCYKCGLLGHNGKECRGARGETSTGTPSSCFRCGEEGHFARECTISVKEGRGARGETSTGTPSSCFRCGEEGHFARECTISVKAKKRTRDLSTGKRPREKKDRKGMKSAPQDLGKDHEKKKLQFDELTPNKSSKSKRRGGWITDDPGDLPREKKWRSPSTPNTKHKIYTLTNASKDSSSQYAERRSNFSSGNSSSHGYGQAHHHPRFSASRFGYGNSSNDGMRRNYDCW